MNDRIRGYAGKFPKMGKPIYIDPLATVIGDVELGDYVSIWPNAVIRGDSLIICIGSWSNIQDNCMVHAGPHTITEIGEYCTVGHGAILHGCSIGNNCMVGMGSIVMNGANIGDYCMIGAGTLITEGKIFPARSLIIGSPGKVVRELTVEEISGIREAAEHYWDNALVYMQKK